MRSPASVIARIAIGVRNKQGNAWRDQKTVKDVDVTAEM